MTYIVLKTPLNSNQPTNLSEAFQSQTNMDKILYNESR